MVFRGINGLNFFNICLTVEESLEKTSNGVMTSCAIGSKTVFY